MLETRAGVFLSQAESKAGIWKSHADSCVTPCFLFEAVLLNEMHWYEIFSTKYELCLASWPRIPMSPKQPSLLHSKILRSHGQQLVSLLGYYREAQAI